MELAARRFARKVLLIHLALLVLVVLLVSAGVRYMYTAARTQAIAEAQTTQELLARQTARGIENYYESVTSVLNLLQPDEAELKLTPPPRPVAGNDARNQRRKFLESGPLVRILSNVSGSIWKNIEDKASLLFVVDPADGMAVIKVIGSTDNSLNAEAIATQATPWLKTAEKKAISPFMHIGEKGAHLLCVPMRGPERLLMVAVVPISGLEQSMLEQINRSAETGSTISDDAGTIVSASRAGMVGHKLTEIKDPRTRALALKYGETKSAGTEVFESPDSIGDVQLDPSMVSIQPVEVLGKTWMLAIASSLKRVDDLVKPIFRNAMIWAGFVMLATTGILVSTAVQMIRSRSRLERVQMEIINRELTQAREIQLSWLPKKPVATDVLDLAAVNRPASHVSGDFYNWFELPDKRVAVIIGDVTGHGMAAAFLMATTQLLVRMSMQRVCDPGKCLTDVNDQLCSQIFSGQFVTMLLCVIDPAAHTIDLATAGHPPPIIGNGHSQEPMPVEPQLVLGIEPDVEYSTQRFPLSVGNTVLMYTDGVIEAKAMSGERLNIDGLAASLNGDTSDAATLAEAVTTIVDRFRGGRELEDDLTLVAIQLRALTTPVTPVLATAAS